MKGYSVTSTFDQDDSNREDSLGDDVFYERCPQIFEKSGMTIAEVAERAGMEYHTVRAYLRGKSRPRPKQRKQLARALNTTFEYLFGYSEEPDRPVTQIAYVEKFEVEPVRSNLASEAAVKKAIEGIALEVSGGRLVTREAWIEGALWPVQTELAVFDQRGCQLIFYNRTFSADHVDLGPTKEVAALKYNLQKLTNPGIAEYGVVFALVVDGTSLSADQLKTQLIFFRDQMSILLEKNVAQFCVLMPRSSDRVGSATELLKCCEPHSLRDLETNLRRHFENIRARN